LRLQIGDGAATDLILHSTDGLRQERRARGLSAQPHVYRGAVEVPKALWDARAEQAEPLRSFLQEHFGEQRFLAGTLAVTASKLQISQSCWNLQKPGSGPSLSIPNYDPGLYLNEVLAALEEGRLPALCLPP
jgi:hypothetical protein